MVKIMIVTHGRLAEGFLDAIKLLAGEDALKDIETVILEPLDSPESLYEKIKSKIHNEDMLIFVDLFGGTPSRAAAMLAAEKLNIRIIAGVNLPMLIEAVLNKDKPLEELTERVIRAGIKGIVDVNKKLEAVTKKKS